MNHVSLVPDERLRLLVEAVEDYAIFLLDPAGIVTTWNRGAERINGYRAEEILGKHFSVFYPPEAIEKGWPQHELEVARREGRFEDEGWRLRRDGSQVWANVTITALSDEAGRHVGFAKITRDLTERWRAARRQAALAERLRRSNRELEQFASIAAHDLQEPLRKIEAFGDRLVSRCQAQLDERGRDYLERMRSSAVRMRRLINDLLAFSRVVSKAQPFSPIDLAQVAREVISDLEESIERHQGRVEMGELPSINADPLQMRQLFQNLIGNALKFHKPDEPPVVKISAKVTESGGTASQCVISIEDNGIGFEEQYGERIFEVFQRLHGRHEYEGTGIGLAICRKITERHGGTIKARSIPGQGSVFIIELPFDLSTEGEQRAETSGADHHLDG